MLIYLFIGVVGDTVSQSKRLRREQSVIEFKYAQDPWKIDFPLNGIGSQVFGRNDLVESIVVKIDELSKTGDVCNMYLRGPRGSGKSVLLQLIGKMLQDRGEKVYFVRTADQLREVNASDMQDLIDMNNSRNRIYLLVDEVQMYYEGDVWDFLLKQTSKIVTIGVGIPQLDVDSAAFLFRPPPSYILLTQYDVKDSTKYFISLAANCLNGSKVDLSDDAEDDSNVIDEMVAEVLNWVFVYTGGQAYPYYYISNFLLSKHCKDCFEGNYENIITGGVFRKSTFFEALSSRALSLNSKALSAARQILRTGKRTDDEKIILSKVGVWLETRNWFISDLLVSHIFNENEKELSSAIDFSEPNALLKLIVYGFSELTDEDFMEPARDNFRYENSLTAIIGYQLSRVPNLYMSPQTQIARDGPLRAGAQPTIDLYLNGRLNLFVKFTKNGSKLKEHFDRF